MIVSEYHSREKGRENGAIGWLQRQMAWEQVLDRLRREAGVAGDACGQIREAA